MNVVIASLTHLYSKLLLLYPGRFQDEFAGEMQDVFRDSVNEAIEDGILSLVLVCLRELGELPFNILQEFWHEFERKETKMVTNEKANSKSSIVEGASRWDALIGTLPFVLFGIASVIGKFEFPTHGLYPFMTAYLITLVGLVIGGIEGFPHWAYSYLGWSGVYAWWWMGMSVDTFSNRYFPIIHNQLLGWWSWIPFLLAIGVPLLWTRSLHPLRRVAKGIWGDWTMLSLAMYALVGFTALLYDENHHPYLIAFMIASTLAISGSVWIFMKGTNTRKRIIALISGFAAVAFIGWICESTWDWRAYYGLPPQPSVVWYASLLRTVVVFAFWGAILFWPVVVGLAQRAVNNRRIA